MAPIGEGVLYNWSGAGLVIKIVPLTACEYKEYAHHVLGSDLLTHIPLSADLFFSFLPPFAHIKYLPPYTPTTLH
jgi:hypothetical protein